MRFTLRDLFWLTLVVAALLGWAVDRSRLANEIYDIRNRDSPWPAIPRVGGVPYPSAIQSYQ